MRMPAQRRKVMLEDAPASHETGRSGGARETLMNHHVTSACARVQLCKRALFVLVLCMIAARVEAADSGEFFRTRVARSWGHAASVATNSWIRRARFLCRPRRRSWTAASISAGKPDESHFLSVLLPQKRQAALDAPKAVSRSSPKRSTRSGNGSRPEPSCPQG